MQFVHGSILSSTHQNPRMFVLDHSEIEIYFQVHGCQEVVGPFTVPPGIAAHALDLGSARGNEDSQHPWGESSKNHRPRADWPCSSYQLLPCARTKRVRKTLVSLTGFCTMIRSSEDVLAICFQMSAVSLESVQKEFTSCEFTLFSNVSF